MKLLKPLISALVLAAAWYIGSGFYHYYRDTHKPEIAVQGIVPDGVYADEIALSIEGADSYKIKEISAWLDGKPLLVSHKVRAKNLQYPFSLSTKNLANGKHMLKVEMVNGLYHPQKAVQEITFTVDNSPLQAALVKQESENKVFQGHTFHVQFQVNKPLSEASVHLLSKKFSAFPESPNSLIYEAYVPIECEEASNEYPYSITLKDHVGNNLVLEGKMQIVAFPFKKQLLTISPEKVEEERKAGESQKKLEEDLVLLSAQSPHNKLWQGSFIAPIEIQQITTPYGTIRITQERGRYAHKALDVINLPRSVVWAPQDGIVVKKDRYEYSGNTVVIDHGYGILTLLFHLDSFADIKVGDRIKRGNPVGKLGKTGYASGYHLHWELRVANIPVEPLEWTKPNF